MTMRGKLRMLTAAVAVGLGQAAWADHGNPCVTADPCAAAVAAPASGPAGGLFGRLFGGPRAGGRLVPVTETVTRKVNETVLRDVTETVRRPVYETATRQVTDTVMRDVCETTLKEVRYTVQKPVTETCYRDVSVTVKRCVDDPSCPPTSVFADHAVCETVCRQVPVCTTQTVCETTMKDVCRTVARPVTECVTKQVCKTVARPVTETHMKEVCREVSEPVQTTRTVCKQVPVQACETVTRHGRLHLARVGDACPPAAGCGTDPCQPVADPCQPCDPCGTAISGGNAVGHVGTRLGLSGLGNALPVGGRLGLGNGRLAFVRDADSTTSRAVTRYESVSETVPVTTHVKRTVREMVPVTTTRIVKETVVESVSVPVTKMVKETITERVPVTVRKKVPVTTMKTVTEVVRRTARGAWVAADACGGAAAGGQLLGDAGKGVTAGCPTFDCGGPGRVFVEGRPVRVIPATKMVNVCETRKVPHTVKRTVCEEVVKMVPTTCTKRVPTTVTRCVPVTTCRIVTEVVTRKVPTTVCVDKTETVTKWVPAPACDPCLAATPVACCSCAAGGLAGVMTDPCLPKPLRDFLSGLFQCRLGADPCRPVSCDPCAAVCK